MVDTLALGASAARREGSSPFSRTILRQGYGWQANNSAVTVLVKVGKCKDPEDALRSLGEVGLQGYQRVKVRGTKPRVGARSEHGFVEKAEGRQSFLAHQIKNRLRPVF